MSTSKHFDKLAISAICLALVISIVLVYCTGSGVIYAENDPIYTSLLFDSGRVHTIDIEMEDWDAFIESCESEEYSLCNITIDGTKINNVGIRAKGNTSLSNVSSLGSDRYSFKVEFDHYDDSINYYGLDKLCLNNIIQDNTYMKDFLTYKLMDEMGVASPLASYAYITVNGEDWGLYLAVEAVEDSFISRNYDSIDGNLYKPDSMSMGGGKGNGMNFDFEEFQNQIDDSSSMESDNPWNQIISGGAVSGSDEGGSFQMPNMQNFSPNDAMNMTAGGMSMPGINTQGGEMPNMQNFNFDDIKNMTGGGINIPDIKDFTDSDSMDKSIQDGIGSMFGSSDVKLQYIDDNIDSYSNIFDNAKTSVSASDKEKLIASLKTLSMYVDGEDVDVSQVVDVESVINYFVVHTYVCNGDSYTGSMIHNYYLYEDDGVMSMIPWDYNLAFGGFQSGNASTLVNEDIYSPVSGGLSDRPMIAWIFESESYTALYEEAYREFLKIDINAMIEETYAMIAQYVQKDPSKFCTYDEFVTAKETLAKFCELRSEAVSRQLDGNAEAVETGDLNISDMGSMNTGNQGGFGGGKSDVTDFDQKEMQKDKGEMNQNDDFSKDMTKREKE